MQCNSRVRKTAIENNEINKETENSRYWFFVGV